MLRSRATAQRFRRRSAPLALRSLAALVALLLVGSSLGQVAHFLLVQHTVCAEHGELLEVHAGTHSSARATESHESAEQTRASAPDHEAEHDHCQLLARAEREQLLPPAATVSSFPPASSELVAPAFVGAASAAEPLLSLAPKTSPPRHAALG